MSTVQVRMMIVILVILSWRSRFEKREQDLDSETQNAGIQVPLATFGGEKEPQNSKNSNSFGFLQFIVI